jgi:hypothetical protein
MPTSRRIVLASAPTFTAAHPRLSVEPRTRSSMASSPASSRLASETTTIAGSGGTSSGSLGSGGTLISWRTWQRGASA